MVVWVHVYVGQTVLFKSRQSLVLVETQTLSEKTLIYMFETVLKLVASSL